MFLAFNIYFAVPTQTHVYLTKLWYMHILNVKVLHVHVYIFISRKVVNKTTLRENIVVVLFTIFFLYKTIKLYLK